MTSPNLLPSDMTALEQARARRNASKTLFDTRLAAFRADLAEHSVKEQIAAKASADASRALEHTLDVANQSKGVIAATVGALAVWFLRQPIIAFIERHVAGDEASEDESVEPLNDEAPPT